jgi:hypothetical protein
LIVFAKQHSKIIVQRAEGMILFLPVPIIIDPYRRYRRATRPDPSISRCKN